MWTQQMCIPSTNCAIMGERDAHLQMRSTCSSWVTIILINAHVRTEPKRFRRSWQPDSHTCFWDPPSPPECRERAMTWACNGTDDTPYCAESSLCSVYATTSGLLCSPAAETLPRRDETYSLNKYECRVSLRYSFHSQSARIISSTKKDVRCACRRRTRCLLR